MLVCLVYLIISVFTEPAGFVVFFLFLFLWMNCVGVALNRDGSVLVYDYATEVFKIPSAFELEPYALVTLR